MQAEIPEYWQREVDLLEQLAQNYANTHSIPALDLRFMAHCVGYEQGSSEEFFFLKIEDHLWTLIRRDLVGISWEIQSPDKVIVHATNSQVEDRLDREVLDFKARLLTSQKWHEEIALLRTQGWTWPAGQTLKLYRVEWEGFRKDEIAWAADLTPDEEGFISLWQEDAWIGVRLLETRHCLTRRMFDRLADLPPQLKRPRSKTLRGIGMRGQLIIEEVGQELIVPLGDEPVPWVKDRLKQQSCCYPPRDSFRW